MKIPTVSSLKPMQWMRELSPRLSFRKRRLVACGACRQIWYSLTYLQQEKIRRLENEPTLVCYSNREDASHQSYTVMCAMFPEVTVAQDRALIHAHLAIEENRKVFPGEKEYEDPKQIELIQDICGRIGTPEPNEWSPRLLQMAESIYQTRSFEDLPYLSDLLEEEGCLDWELLEHCKSPQKHYLGCWALDWILGKE